MGGPRLSCRDGRGFSCNQALPGQRNASGWGDSVTIGRPGISFLTAPTFAVESSLAGQRQTKTMRYPSQPSASGASSETTRRLPGIPFLCFPASVPLSSSRKIGIDPGCLNATQSGFSLPSCFRAFNIVPFPDETPAAPQVRDLGSRGFSLLSRFCAFNIVSVGRTG